MRILFVSPRQCWPPIGGAKLREYHLVRILGRYSAITHVSFRQAGLPPVTAADLPFCERVIALPPLDRYTPLKLARGILGSWPLPVINYTAGSMQSALAALLRQERFDLLHLDGAHLAGYEPMLRRASNAPVVYDWHNIESEVMRRYRSSAPRRINANLTTRRMVRLEERILCSGFGHLVCSERERSELLRVAPGARVAVIPNGVDTGFFEAAAPAADRRHRIVFTGLMGYHANVEAAVAFARAVWPRIRARFPEWRLTLVGADPAPGVLALRAEPNVEITGTVPDVRPYYREAVAAIVPLRTGGGTRLKILEAMAAGVPVVSTSLGAEGLDVNPGADILIADRDEHWLPHLEALATRPEFRDRLVSAAHGMVRVRYDWEVLGAALWNTYRSWLDAPASLSRPLE